MSKKVYRLTIWSHYEDDNDEPYTIDYNSMDEALNAMILYEDEVTLCGQHAYSVSYPEVLEVENA